MRRVWQKAWLGKGVWLFGSVSSTFFYWESPYLWMGDLEDVRRGRVEEKWVMNQVGHVGDKF